MFLLPCQNLINRNYGPISVLLVQLPLVRITYLYANTTLLIIVALYEFWIQKVSHPSTVFFFKIVLDIW